MAKRTCGWRARNGVVRLATMASAVGIAAMRSCPVNPWRSALISARIARASPTMRRAQSSTFSPSGVKLWKREPRLTSSTPICSSSCLIPADSVGWVTPQASAAWPKCRSRASARRKSSLSINVLALELACGRGPTIASDDREFQSIDRTCGIVFDQPVEVYSKQKKVQGFQMNAPVKPPEMGNGSGRKRPRRTPKGRQLDIQALDEVRALLGERPRRRDLLIEHLHLIQDRYGHLSAAHLAALADEMKLAQTEVYEVATFYAHFDVVKEGETPPPAVTVRVCDSLSCAMAGAEDLLEKLPGLLGKDVRVLRAPCMGACDKAPVAAVGHVQVTNAGEREVSDAVGRNVHAQAHKPQTDFADYRGAGGY